MFTIPIKKWEDLTDDKEAIEALEDVYGGNVEELDLLVGLMAEKKIKGFAISETAFNVFLLMATRYIYIYYLAFRLLYFYFSFKQYQGRPGLKLVKHLI